MRTALFLLFIKTNFFFLLARPSFYFLSRVGTVLLVKTPDLHLGFKSGFKTKPFSTAITTRPDESSTVPYPIHEDRSRIICPIDLWSYGLFI